MSTVVFFQRRSEAFSGLNDQDFFIIYFLLTGQ